MNRVKHYGTILRSPWLVLGAILGIVGAASTVEQVSRLVRLPWYAWVMGMLTVVIAGLLEGSYRVVAGMTRAEDAAKNRLAQLRVYGVTKLFAIPPQTDEELTQWKDRRERWVTDVCELLERAYGTPARLKFYVLGPIPVVRFTHALNDDHAHELAILTRRLEILGEIIDGA